MYLVTTSRPHGGEETKLFRIEENAIKYEDDLAGETKIRLIDVEESKLTKEIREKWRQFEQQGVVYRDSNHRRESFYLYLAEQEPDVPAPAMIDFKVMFGKLEKEYTDFYEAQIKHPSYPQK